MRSLDFHQPTPHSPTFSALIAALRKTFSSRYVHVSLDFSCFQRPKRQRVEKKRRKQRNYKKRGDSYVLSSRSRDKNVFNVPTERKLPKGLALLLSADTFLVALLWPFAADADVEVQVAIGRGRRQRERVPHPVDGGHLARAEEESEMGSQVLNILCIVF